ncbi:hypothetical protein LCGC14_2319050, partial [marine sediment metagenome]
MASLRSKLPLKLQHRITRLLVAAMRAAGFDLIRRHYYSPVPDVAGLTDDFWRRSSPLHGLSLDLRSQIEFLESDLAEFIPEFNPPNEPTGIPGQFYLNNDLYESVDAEVLYATVRHFKPRRVLELGSGCSSLVISAACKKNAADGHTTDYQVYDPFMSPLLT